MTNKEMRAYQKLFPKSSWVEESDGTIRSDNPAIAEVTKAEIDAEIIKIDAEDALIKYQKDRRREYPSVGDQLDMLMKDMKDGTTTHQEACEAVKTKYPKP
jgi:hypothetical protein